MLLLNISGNFQLLIRGVYIMVKYLFICLLVICSCAQVKADTRYVTTSTPIPNSSYAYNYQDDYGSAKLAEIESSILGRHYIGQNIDLRLNRLEQTVFNRTYPNSTITQRIDNLVVYHNNNSGRFANNNNTINPVSSNNKVKGIINGITSSFFGTPTGLTPPINPYYSYGSNGYGSNYGDYQDYYGNNGWYRKNNSIGNNTGVHILD